MKAASVKQIKDELKEREPAEILKLCLRLATFKKENKELLTYLLFESENEAYYVQNIKEEVEELFNQIVTRNYYLRKKTIRRILKDIKKYIRYSSVKETEIELLIHFCQTLKAFDPRFKRYKVLKNTFEKQIEIAEKRLLALHEDLQYDYRLEIQELKN